MTHYIYLYLQIFSQSFSDDLSDVKVNQAVDEPNTTEIGFIPVVSENKETSANDTLSHSHTECEVKSDWIQSKDLIYEEESLNATEISTSNDLTLNHDLYLDVIKYEENKIEDEPNLLSHFIAEGDIQKNINFLYINIILPNEIFSCR